MIPDTFKAEVAGILAMVALLVGLASGGYVAHLYYAPRVHALEVERDAYKNQVQQLGDQISDQNRAIDKLKKDADARAEKAEKAIRAAQAAREQAEADAQNLLLMQPKPGEDRCTAANRLIGEELAQ